MAKWTAAQKKSWVAKMKRALGDPQSDSGNCGKAQEVLREVPAAMRGDGSLDWEYYAGVINQNCGDSGEFDGIDDEDEDEEVKSIEREDGSVVRDLADVDLDENLSAIARVVRGPLAAAPSGPGLFSKLYEVAKKPVVYIPVGIGLAYFLYRMFAKPSAMGAAPVTDQVRARMRAQREAYERQQEAQDPARAEQAAVEAEAVAAELEAQAAAMGEPQEPREEDDRPPITSYVN